MAWFSFYGLWFCIYLGLNSKREFGNKNIRHLSFNLCNNMENRQSKRFINRFTWSNSFSCTVLGVTKFPILKIYHFDKFDKE